MKFWKKINFNTNDEIILRNEIEEENMNRNLEITQMISFKYIQKHLNKIIIHHLIIIFIHNINEINECIKYDIFIQEKYYYSEKYIFEFNIIQCYKYYEFEYIIK